MLLCRRFAIALQCTLHGVGLAEGDMGDGAGPPSPYHSCYLRDGQEPMNLSIIVVTSVAHIKEVSRLLETKTNVHLYRHIRIYCIYTYIF